MYVTERKVLLSRSAAEPSTIQSPLELGRRKDVLIHGDGQSNYRYLSNVAAVCVIMTHIVVCPDTTPISFERNRILIRMDWNGMLGLRSQDDSWQDLAIQLN